MPETKTRDASFALWVEHRQQLLFLFAFLAIVGWTIIYFQFSIDDAYISFRYGRVLVADHVWNWNPSGARVESYTSATYTVLSILPALLHISSAFFFKLVGLLFVGIMIYRLYTRSASRFAVILGVLFFALDPWVWLHAFSGLETPLYMLLILEMALCVNEAPERGSAYIYLVFLLLPLTRPEGMVFGVVGLLLFWYRRGSAPKLLPWFGLAIFSGTIYFIARWYYFRQPLPNPFYVKIDHSTLRETLVNLASNLSGSKGYFLTLLLVLLLSRKLHTRAFSLIALLLALFLFAPHAMMMNYADRFYFQMVFPIVVIFLICEDLLHISRIATIVVAVALCAITLGDLRSLVSYYPELHRAHVDLGKRLAPFANNHTLLMGDAGAVPFYSNWVSYDYLGLCTNAIARHGVTLPLLHELHPDLIILYSEDPSTALTGARENPDSAHAQDVVVQYIRESGEYQYAGASNFGGSYHYLVEYIRRDTPDKGLILEQLHENAETSAHAPFSLKKLLLQKYVPWAE